MRKNKLCCSHTFTQSNTIKNEKEWTTVTCNNIDDTQKPDNRESRE